jgi:predicted O-methyltransferase YrrM
MPIFKRTLSEFLFRRFALKHYASNLLLDMQLESKAESLDYLKKNMRAAPYFEKHPRLVAFAMSLADKPGLVLELGVGRGKSMRWLASHTERTVHGFDSFEGIPEYWNGNLAGAFAQKKLPKVPHNVVLHRGTFDRTLPEFLAKNRQAVSFLHVDCDLYGSTVTIFGLLSERLQPGAIVLFDEYFNYPRWQEHEYKAFQEFVERSGAEYEYVAYSVTGQQVAVRILRNPLWRPNEEQ